jgi:hypothetical protein
VPRGGYFDLRLEGQPATAMTFIEGLRVTKYSFLANVSSWGPFPVAGGKQIFVFGELGSKHLANVFYRILPWENSIFWQMLT